jgi:arginine decarboxylase
MADGCRKGAIGEQMHVSDNDVGVQLKIAVVSGVGKGSTLLSSFDDALRHCGVYNYNLIPLSSVIPPGSEIVDTFEMPNHEFGHRLYVVMAEARSAEPSRAVAAGIGWYQWHDGRGVFVEHETVSGCREEAAEEVCSLIGSSLQDLCAGRGIPFDPERVRCRISAAETEGAPTTALVLGVYRSHGWS